jgi:hypothetical protein
MHDGNVKRYLSVVCIEDEHTVLLVEYALYLVVEDHVAELELHLHHHQLSSTHMKSLGKNCSGQVPTVCLSSPIFWAT